MSESRTSPHTEEPTGPVAAALLREHHDIDAGIEAFQAIAAEPGADLAGWAKPLVDAMTALRRHIYLEEVMVFPKLRTGGLMMAIMVMIREHAQLWIEMDALDEKLGAAVSEGAAPSADRAAELVDDCRRMLELLEAHNMKEEPVIYPHIDSELDPGLLRQLEAFLADGEMPEGWVCEGVRG